jgi:hypothetical protein
MQRAGSVLWSSYGWEVTPRSPAETYRSGVNLAALATDALAGDADGKSAGRSHRVGIPSVNIVLGSPSAIYRIKDSPEAAEATLAAWGL